MKQPAPATVCFRRRLVNPDGEDVIEEREVQCASDQLADILGAPWREHRRLDAEDGAAPQFREAVREAVEALAIEVRESCTPEGRRWTLRLSGHPESPLAESVHQDGDATRLAGTLRSVILGDGDAPHAGIAQGGHRMLVHNQGLSVVNQDNVYAIIDLHLNLTLNLGGDTRPAAAGDGDASP